MTFICYPGCSTCAKARRMLESAGVAYTERNIKTEPPTADELRAWQARSGLPLKRFFNTSGQIYRSLELSKRLAGMSEAEQFRLLASDGMLVKRPLLIGDDFVLVGLRESEWTQHLNP